MELKDLMSKYAYKFAASKRMKEAAVKVKGMTTANYYAGQEDAFYDILKALKQLSIASSDRVRKGNITCESCGECNSKVQSPAICTSDIYCSMQGDIIGEQGD